MIRFPRSAVRWVSNFLKREDGPTAVDQGSPASFAAVASDPGGVAGYSWTASLGGVVVASGSGASFAFVPTAANGAPV
ncbi:MAG: hypothetical protein J0I06_21785, partial [Planctomycetes bacterium]|nr:hypothetical protein [Planctomycetota bacterium]